MLEAVRIACAGFPTRKPFMPFAQRYALLLPEAPHNARQQPSGGGGGSNGGGLALPLTPSGFIDWLALSEKEVRAAGGGTGGGWWRRQCGTAVGAALRCAQAGPTAPCAVTKCRSWRRPSAAAPQVAEVARRVLFASQLDGWQLGKSRVFLRAGQLAQLEVGRRGRRPGRQRAWLL